MKKKIVCGFGALVSLFLIGSLVQSRGSRANGAYSTPVTAMNTTANPAGTLGAELAARAPYESSVNQVCPPGIGNCQFVFTGPGQAFPGHRLVIENVSGAISLFPGTTTMPGVTLGVANNNPNGGAIGNIWGIPPGPIVPLVGSILQSAFNQRVLVYIDGGGSASVNVYANHTGNSVVTLSGYLQDCLIAPCPTTLHN